MSRRVKIGTVSMLLDRKMTGVPYFDTMIDNAQTILDEVALEKPDLMILPEYFAFAHLDANDKKRKAEEIPDLDGPVQKTMSGLAKTYRFI